MLKNLKETYINPLIRLKKAKKYNSQYAKGQWQWLDNLDEQHRHGIFTTYIRYLKKDASVLDIGCGTGIIHNYLHLPFLEHYTGVDFSEAAIAEAKAKNLPKTTFIVGNGETFIPEGKFDFILFNECIYYFIDPVQTMNRYKSFLKPDGKIIVGVFEIEKHQKFWEQMPQYFKMLDFCILENKNGSRWKIAVLS